MRALIALSLLLPAAQLATSTAILFPLYFDPDPVTCWPELRSAAAAHPSLPFVLILNPNSGPVNDPTNAQIACIPKLRSSIPNAKIVGYVSTAYGKRTTGLVQRDITAYRNWARIREGGVAVPIDGIFLDEVSNDPGRTNWGIYQAYSSYVKRSFGAKAFIVLNPGYAIPARFYPLANLLVTFESSFSDWGPRVISQEASRPLAKQVIMIHSFPAGPPTSTNDMDTILSAFAPTLGAVYFTDLVYPNVDVYGNFGGDWAEFVGEVVKYNVSASVPGRRTFWGRD